MEHYSRNKIVLRILNTVFFAILLFVNIRLIFFSNESSLINIVDIKFFMSPYKYIYILNFISLLSMLIFIVVQIDSSSHGIKKKVVENYSFFLALTFIFMSLHLYFWFQLRYSTSFMFILLSNVLSILIYLKSQNMKKYMYNDEVFVFVYPFSIFMAWNLIMMIISFNLMMKDAVLIGSTLSVVIAIIELIIVVATSILALLFYNDRICIAMQILYLISIAINTKLNNYFMPVGYLCFLSIIVMLIFFYKTKSRKK